MSKLMYLAGPHERGTFKTQDWRADAKEAMSAAEDWITFDPCAAWTLGTDIELDDKIAHLNRIALGMASALVVSLPDVQSAQAFMEIAWAERRGIPIAWFGEDIWEEHWALQLRGIQRVPDLESALAWGIGHARDNETRSEVQSTIRVQKLASNAILPTKTHTDDAGWDLYVTHDTLVSPGKWEDVPLGVAIQPPPGIWFRIVGRSSTFRKRRILVLEGIIDEGYRGELFVGCTNLGTEDVEIKAGERICQMLPAYTHTLDIKWATVLSASSRGSAGFGSTGS